MNTIPRDPWPESTLLLLSDPYRFVSRRCQRYGAEVFEARLALRRTLCLSSPAAAELFCDESRFERGGVAPAWLQKTLFGQGGVQGLDGDAHRHRKALFLSLMSRPRVAALAARTAEGWREAARRWASMDSVVLYDEARELLARSVLDWAGVPVGNVDLPTWTRDLTAMFDQAAGPGHFASRRARRRTEQRVGALIDDIRSGSLRPEPDTAAAVIAAFRDIDGALLDRHTAAVELINVLRPTVAVAVYVVFVALALHRHPECRERLRTGDEAYAQAFVQEVRRTCPFFPLVMARVRADFEWQGFHFPAGRRAVLDLYGINHHPGAWERPDRFEPERFMGWAPDPYRFVPQGGGDPSRHHRCPGEPIAIAVMKEAARFLAGLDHEVPPQDLGIQWKRLPALPRSRFVMRNVRVQAVDRDAGAPAAGRRAG